MIFNTFLFFLLTKCNMLLGEEEGQQDRKQLF